MSGQVKINMRFPSEKEAIDYMQNYLRHYPPFPYGTSLKVIPSEDGFAVVGERDKSVA